MSSVVPTNYKRLKKLDLKKVILDSGVECNYNINYLKRDELIDFIETVFYFFSYWGYLENTKD